MSAASRKRVRGAPVELSVDAANDSLTFAAPAVAKAVARGVRLAAGGRERAAGGVGPVCAAEIALLVRPPEPAGNRALS